MDKFSLMVPNFIPAKEYVDSKNTKVCIGCGVGLAARHIGKIAGNLMKTAVVERHAAGAGLFGVHDAAGLLRIKQGKKEIVICLDDEPGNTLEGAVEKKAPAIAVAEGYGYVATASPSYPFDLQDKIKRALEAAGNAYVHVLCPCPAGWGFATEDTVKLGFWAVESLAFPLYEVAGGYYNQTVKTLKPRALAEYIGPQARFEKATDKQMAAAQAKVQKLYAKLTETLESQMHYTYETTGPVY
jgi:pyruvate/2-oxoacid:ferredoxin oxidoreductase beta subunit